MLFFLSDRPLKKDDRYPELRLNTFRQHNLHLISRVRRTTVGYAPFCSLPDKRDRLAESQVAFRQQVARKVEAFERFVNLNAMALGILQILSLELANSIWQGFPRWFRTLPQHGYPTEQVVRLTLQHQAPMILAGSRPALLLPKFLAGKATLSEPSWTAWLTG